MESELFRRSYSREPRAKFIGVWDTVGALGLPVGGLLQFINKRWSFNDMTLSSWVDNAFQALAIDERRKPFRPSIWEKSPNADGQVLEQIWFADVHSNVGGSYPRAGLSDITLLWMIGKAEACGLAIDRSCVSTVDNPKPDPLGTLYDSQTVWYKITGLGDYVHPIGQKDKESVADTVIDRMGNKSLGYEPTNVQDFLARKGNVARIVQTQVPGGFDGLLTDSPRPLEPQRPDESRNG